MAALAPLLSKALGLFTDHYDSTCATTVDLGSYYYSVCCQILPQGRPKNVFFTWDANKKYLKSFPILLGALSMTRLDRNLRRFLRKLAGNDLK